MLKPAFAPAIAGRCLRREFMNNLIWRSVTCRPGKKSVLPKGKADPCSRRRYRQTRPEGRSPPLRGCLRSGYALPSTAPQRHSHPDCRAVLTLIVALDSGLIALLHRLGLEYHKPEVISRKLDPKTQKAFIASYEDLLNSKGDDEVAIFVDAVHPTHAARPVGCWAPKEQKLAIEQTSGRERINIHG